MLFNFEDIFFQRTFEIVNCENSIIISFICLGIGDIINQCSGFSLLIRLETPFIKLSGLTLKFEKVLGRKPCNILTIVFLVSFVFFCNFGNQVIFQGTK